MEIKTEDKTEDKIEDTLTRNNKSLIRSAFSSKIMTSVYVAIFVFIITLILVVKTPILTGLNIIGGVITERDYIINVFGDSNEAEQTLIEYYGEDGALISREELISNINRLDSLEREVMLWKVYADNIAVILAGKKRTITIDKEFRDSSMLGTTKLEYSNIIDSLLRKKVISGVNQKRKLIRQNEFLNMFKPMSGYIREAFNEKTGSVIVQANGIEPVSVITRGSVIFSTWNPTDGYSIVVQHVDNLVSSYSNMKHVIVNKGDVLSAGSIIGYVGGNIDDDMAKTVISDDMNDRYLKFTLWDGGLAVDPESHIMF